MAGILALLATAVLLGTYNIQTVKAAKNFGETASGQARDGFTDSQGNSVNGNGLDANSNDHRTTFGGDVSNCARIAPHCG